MTAAVKVIGSLCHTYGAWCIHYGVFRRVVGVPANHNFGWGGRKPVGDSRCEGYWLVMSHLRSLVYLLWRLLLKCRSFGAEMRCFAGLRLVCIF